MCNVKINRYSAKCKTIVNLVKKVEDCLSNKPENHVIYQPRNLLNWCENDDQQNIFGEPIITKTNNNTNLVSVSLTIYQRETSSIGVPIPLFQCKQLHCKMSHLCAFRLFCTHNFLEYPQFAVAISNSNRKFN